MTNLGRVKTTVLDKYILLGLSIKWLELNDGKPIEFDAKLKDSKLILCANLAGLQSTKEVITNVT